MAMCVSVENDRKYSMPPVPVISVMEKADAVKAVVKDAGDGKVTIAAKELEYVFDSSRQIMMREPYVRKPAFDEVYHFYSTMFAFETTRVLKVVLDLPQIFGANNPEIVPGSAVIALSSWTLIFFNYNTKIPDRNFKSVYEKFTLNALNNCTPQEYLVLMDHIFSVINVTRAVGNGYEATRGKYKDYKIFVGGKDRWGQAASELRDILGTPLRAPVPGLQLHAPKRVISVSEDTKCLSIYDAARKMNIMGASFGGSSSVLSQKILNRNFPFRPSDNYRQHLICWYIVKCALSATTRRLGVYCDKAASEGLDNNFSPEERERITYFVDSSTAWQYDLQMFTIFFNFSPHVPLAAGKSELEQLKKLDAIYERYDIYYGPLLSKDFCKGRKLYKFVLNMSMHAIMSKVPLKLCMGSTKDLESEVTWDDMMKHFQVALNYIPGRALSFMGWDRHYWALPYRAKKFDIESTLAAEVLTEFTTAPSGKGEDADDQVYDEPSGPSDAREKTPKYREKKQQQTRNQEKGADDKEKGKKNMEKSDEEVTLKRSKKQSPPLAPPKAPPPDQKEEKSKASSTHDNKPKAPPQEPRKDEEDEDNNEGEEDEEFDDQNDLDMEDPTDGM